MSTGTESAKPPAVNTMHDAFVEERAALGQQTYWLAFPK